MQAPSCTKMDKLSNHGVSEPRDMENSRASTQITYSLMIATILASLGSFSFGLNLAVVNSTVDTFKNCPESAGVLDCFPVKFTTWGYVAGMLCVGALLGSILVGKFIDSHGRNAMILLSATFYTIGSAIMALSLNVTMLLLGRLLVGVGVGATCIAAPLYITEIAPLEVRGLFGSAHQMAIVTGYLFGEIVGFCGLSKPYYWRLFFALTLIPSISQLLLAPRFCPRSPPFQAAMGKNEEAKLSLRRLRGDGLSRYEYEAMIRAAEENRGAASQSWGLKELFIAHRSVALKSNLIAMTLHVGQQLSGINSVFFFSKNIFSKQTTFSPLVPVLIAILNVIMTLLALAIIDRRGRRILATISSSLMLLASFTLMASFHWHHDMIAVASVLVFVGAFAFGLGPVPWLMTNELFPAYAAGAAVSFAVSCNWICNTIVTFLFPYIWEAVGYWSFIPYTIAIALFLTFSLFILPETKGRPAAFI